MAAAGAVVPVGESDGLKLVSAVARAQNDETIGRVVDESVKRAREARERREAEQAEQRLKEDREKRIQDFERRERATAEATAQEVRQVAEQVARREHEDKVVQAERSRPLDAVDMRA